jgi:hypothetical protein
MHARKIAAGLLCLGALGAAGGVAYARSTGSCCKIGASCCYPGSPCCAHGAVAQQ